MREPLKYHINILLYVGATSGYTIIISATIEMHYSVCEAFKCPLKCI